MISIPEGCRGLIPTDPRVARPLARLAAVCRRRYAVGHAGRRTPAVRTITQTGLNEVARQRLEVVSFFLLGLLACAAVIRSLWNGLRKDFPILPRLSYARALGMIVLWGLLFVLVLTMITGASELMTPGA
jgi:hypothetical protein